MSIDAVFSVSRFGLDSERLRLEVASRNIALANTPLAPGDETGALQVVSRATSDAASFAAALQNGDAPALPTLDVADAKRGVRVVHDPANPLADADGNVRYAEVLLAAEMTALVSASRGYEANVRALNALRAMLLKALEIGGAR